MGGGRGGGEKGKTSRVSIDRMIQCWKGVQTFLLLAQSLSHSIMTTAREDPWATMNCLRPSTVIPCRRTPRTVGKRGSSL